MNWKKYIFPALNLIALCATFILPIWYGIWYAEANKKFASHIDIENINNYDKHSFLDSNLFYKFDFSSPVPYILISLLIICLTQIQSFITTYQLSDLRKKYAIEQDKVEDLRTKINSEQESHSETRKQYHQSLNSHLEILCKNSIGYDLLSCRSSVYRIDRESNKCRLIFRVSNISKYERRGRVSIPSDEGVVGATIQNGDSICILSTKKRYTNSMRKHLSSHGVEISDTTINGLNMKSVSYYGRAVRDLNSHEKIAILIIESTNENQFEKDLLDDFFISNQNEFTKWIQHITSIDADLNPYGVEA